MIFNTQCDEIALINLKEMTEYAKFTHALSDDLMYHELSADEEYCQRFLTDPPMWVDQPEGLEESLAAPATQFTDDEWDKMTKTYTLHLMAQRPQSETPECELLLVDSIQQLGFVFDSNPNCTSLKDQNHPPQKSHRRVPRVTQRITRSLASDVKVTRAALGITKVNACRSTHRKN